MSETTSESPQALCADKGFVLLVARDKSFIASWKRQFSQVLIDELHKIWLPFIPESGYYGRVIYY